MKFWPRKFVHTMADGHLMVMWVDAGPDFFALLGGWLRLRHGLRRRGATPHSPHGTSHYPDFVGKGFRLLAGRDDDYYLAAEDAAGDRFLARVFARGVAPGPPEGPRPGQGADAPDAPDAPAP